MRKIRGTLNLCVSYVLEFLLASYVDAWMREPSPFYTHKFVPVHASLCVEISWNTRRQLCSDSIRRLDSANDKPTHL